MIPKKKVVFSSNLSSPFISIYTKIELTTRITRSPTYGYREIWRAVAKRLPYKIPKGIVSKIASLCVIPLKRVYASKMSPHFFTKTLEEQEKILKRQSKYSAPTYEIPWWLLKEKKEPRE